MPRTSSLALQVRIVDHSPIPFLHSADGNGRLSRLGEGGHDLTSLLSLAQALAQELPGHPLEIDVISTGSFPRLYVLIREPSSILWT